MREDERCERCDYERLELVDAAAYDAALAASQSAVRQAQACLPVLRSLADSEPGEGG